MVGKSHSSDMAMRVDEFDPEGVSNASELTTIARSAGMNTRGEVWNW